MDNFLHIVLLYKIFGRIICKIIFLVNILSHIVNFANFQLTFA